MKNVQLRFAVMLNSNRIPRWQFECINEIITQSEASLITIIYSNQSYSSPERYTSKHFIFRIWRRLFSPQKANLFELVDVRDIAQGAEARNCQVIRKGKFSEYFNEQDISYLESKQLDFILRLGFGILKGNILNAAKYGVWSFHAADEQKYRGGPAHLLGIDNSDEYSAAILQKLTERLDGGIILRKGYFKFKSHTVGENVVRTYEHMKVWPAQVCIDIRNGVANYLGKEPSTTNAELSHAPNNSRMVRIIGKILKNRIKQLFYRIFMRERWNIGVISRPIETFLTNNDTDCVVWSEITNNTRYVADPFGAIIDGEIYSFFEEFEREDGKGRISKASIHNEKGTIFIKREGAFVERAHHLAYPYIYQEDNIMLIQAAADTGGLEVIDISSSDPTKRSLGIILEGQYLVDSTLFVWGGYYWIAATRRGFSSDESLHLWYSSSLLGNWQPHCNNPVKVDIRSARPGGTVFKKGEALFRPAQDCTTTYGRRVVLNRIKKLSPTVFEEVAETTIEPPSTQGYTSGLHTLSQLGPNKTLVDGKRWEFSLEKIKNKLIK